MVNRSTIKRGKSRASLRDFWTNVAIDKPDEPNSCWLWVGPLDSFGYGMYCGQPARRIAALIDCGQIPGSVTFGCHGGTRCVRPAHILRIGEYGRRSSKTGKIPIRYDVDFQEKAYANRHMSDKELATLLTTTEKMVRALRYSFPLLMLRDELAECKAIGVKPQTGPIGAK